MLMKILILVVLVGATAAQAPTMTVIPCEPGANGAAVGQCVLTHLTTSLSQLAGPLPLPDFSYDNGYYSTKLDQTVMTGADVVVTQTPEVNALDDTNVHVMMYFNMTELRINMHAVVGYDTHFSRVFVEGSPEVRVQPYGQSMLDVQLRIGSASKRQAGAGGAVQGLQVEYGTVMVMLPMEMEITANLVEMPWYVPLALYSNVEDEFKNAIVNDWWMSFHPTIGEWLGRYLQNSMFPFDPNMV